MTAEQKAEEIANKRCHEIGCFGHCNFSSPKHHRCGEWHREYNCALDGYHEGFKDCAKSRLNVTTISDCPIKDEEESKYKTAYIKGIRTMANALKDYDRTDGAWTDYFEHTVEKVLNRLLKESE